MTPDSNTDPKTAWLFTRGRQSVRMEARGAGRNLELVVCGPGTKRATYTFADPFALLNAQREIERQVLSEGFRPEEFVTERRRHPRDDDSPSDRNSAADRSCY